MYMTQLNLRVKPDFERDLQRLMELRGIRTKSRAIRLAVREALEAALGGARRTEFNAWIGAALRAPLNPSPRFRDADDLWAPRDGG